MLLGLVRFAQAAPSSTQAVGVGARTLLGARPRAARMVTRLSGAAMIGIGGFLLVDQLIHVTPAGGCLGDEEQV